MNFQHLIDWVSCGLEKVLMDINFVGHLLDYEYLSTFLGPYSELALET